MNNGQETPSLRLWKDCEQLEITSQTSQALVIDSDQPCIASLVKDGDKKEAYAFIVLELLQLCAFFGEAWTPQQLQMLAKEIFAQGHFFKVSELKHFTAQCRAQKFGKMYGKFNPAILMEWLDEYIKTRFEIIEEQRHLEHDSATHFEKVIRYNRTDTGGFEETLRKAKLEYLKSQKPNEAH